MVVVGGGGHANINPSGSGLHLGSLSRAETISHSVPTQVVGQRGRSLGSSSRRRSLWKLKV